MLNWRYPNLNLYEMSSTGVQWLNDTVTEWMLLRDSCTADEIAELLESPTIPPLSDDQLGVIDETRRLLELQKFFLSAVVPSPGDPTPFPPLPSSLTRRCVFRDLDASANECWERLSRETEHIYQYMTRWFDQAWENQLRERDDKWLQDYARGRTGWGRPPHPGESEWREAVMVDPELGATNARLEKLGDEIEERLRKAAPTLQRLERRIAALESHCQRAGCGLPPSD